MTAAPGTHIEAAANARQERLRGSRGLVLVELLLVVAVFVADAHVVLPGGKVPWLVALAWGSLWLRGIGWREVGLALPPRWRVHALGGVLAGMVLEVLHVAVTRPLFARLTGQVADVSDYHDLVGNVYLLMRLLIGSWVLLALGEELVWRGWAMHRFADLYGRGRGGWLAALVFSTAAFGLAHATQGSLAVCEQLLDGVVFAGLYLLGGRNLLLPIVAHGMVATFEFLIVFSGHYPGVG